ncbi:MAG: hypothetical protein K0U12_04085 [Gammaproteobacteria bacterium]|nr:hypothetical protein [Gammaproteobacteria bacterium]
MNWTAIVAVVAGALLTFWLVRMVRGNPKAFSQTNLSKSAYTLGILALILIAVIAVAVMLLRA